MHEPNRVPGLPPWIQFDKLAIIHLEERFSRRAALVHRERLLETELPKESPRALEIGNTNSNMRNAAQMRRRLSNPRYTRGE
jgi:hypothetical protein